jgi:hypothetical protein
VTGSARKSLIQYPELRRRASPNQRFLCRLEDSFRTIALACVCFGLRISECLALKWFDVDWLSRKLNIERGIVRQRVDDLKTVYSGRKMSIDAGMLGFCALGVRQLSSRETKTGCLLLRVGSGVNLGPTIKFGDLSLPQGRLLALANWDLQHATHLPIMARRRRHDRGRRAKVDASW